MYRVWYSTESFADFIIDHTALSHRKDVIKNKMYESDASKPRNFHSTPDHIRKILYLDACDLIVERDTPCGYCAHYAADKTCHPIKGPCNPKWKGRRGPQEAGEGEAE